MKIPTSHPQLPWLFVLIASAGTLSAQPFLYVANQNSSTISVVDTRNNSTVTNAITGFSPVGLAISPDGSRLFAANPNSNLVTVYSTANNQLIANFPIGQAPMGLALDNTRLYVTLHGNAALAVFNAATLGQQVTLRVGFGPCAVAVSSANGRVYVANTYSSTVSVVDPTRIGTPNNPVIGTITVPDSPIALAISANGLNAWVLSSAMPMLSRVNLETGAVDLRVPLPFQPAAMTLAPDNTRIYVSGYGPSVAAVDLREGRILSSVNLPACNSPRCVAMGLALAADGRTLYVANTSRNQISVINTETNQVTANLASQASPRAILLGPAPRPNPTVTSLKSEEEN